MFRQRDSAGFIVTLAVGLALPVACVLWKRPLRLLPYLLMSVGFGLMYAIFFWRYAPSGAGETDHEPDGVK